MSTLYSYCSFEERNIWKTFSHLEMAYVKCSHRGVNLPLAETELPAMSDKDKADIKYGMSKDIDFIAASFVQSADGVREIKQHVKECAKELGFDESYPLPKIISKIESASALIHFDEILKESDGIMVARGDLGVEIPIQQVTNAQKEIVAACNAVGKPVIVATQVRFGLFVFVVLINFLRCD